MTGFIVSVFPFRNRVSPKEAFEGLELGEGKLSRPVLRGPGGRKAAWLLGSNPWARLAISCHLLESREIGNMGTGNNLVTRRRSRVPREFVDATMMVWTRAVRWRAERA